MRYNPKLIEKQMSILSKTNFLLGALSIITIVIGATYINKSDHGGTVHMICYDDREWIQVTWIGTAFVSFHQIFILCQLNVTQYVIVRIPKNMDILQVKDKMVTSVATQMVRGML